MRIVSLFLVVALLPPPVVAEVYRWQDASGKIHYGERPPAGKEARRLPGAPAPVSSGTEKKANASSGTADAPSPALSEPQRRALAEQQALRERNCQQARANLAGIEAGTIRFLVDEKGERIALDGEARERELARARQAVNDWCASPAAGKP